MSAAPAQPAWQDAPTPKPPRRMSVTVLFPSRRQETYAGLFASTFAAYDDALERFPMADRIEVKETAQ